MTKPTRTVLLALALVSMSQYTAAEVSMEELKSISTPDSVETSIGTLKFFDGVPTDDTVKTVYDNLDRMRGVQVFLDTPSRCLTAARWTRRPARRRRWAIPST